MRAELCSRDLSVPTAIANECTFPIVACSTSPAYFTSYDEHLFRLMAGAIQELLRNHHGLLTKTCSLVVGERELLRLALRNAVQPNDVEVHTERPIMGRSSIPRTSRYWCALPALSESIARISVADSFRPRRYDVVPILSPDRRHAVLLNHQGGPHNARCHLSETTSAQARVFIDLVWMTSAVKEYAFRLAHSPILHA